MSEEQIQKLLEEASGLYNDGKYDEAIAIWREILAADPSNQQAREGIKMAQLLTTEWDAGAPDSSVAPPAPAPAVPPRAPTVTDPAIAARVQQGVRRVQELIAAGDLAAAREGTEALQQVAPDDPGVLACIARVECTGDKTSYIDEQLAIARHFLILGETDQSLRACHKVLALDPQNAVAREMVGGAVAGGGAEAYSPPEAPLRLDDEPGAADGPAATDPELPLDLGATQEGAPLDLPLESVEPEPLELPVEMAAVAVASAAAGATHDPGDAGAEPGRIEALLAEGDRLRQAGHLDAAISAWSRVFILQDNHPDAERRIDEAREALEQRARKIETQLYRAEDLLVEKRLPEARQAFEAVLAMRPGHVEAKARIEEIDRKMAAGGEEPGEEEVEAIPLDRPAAPPPPRAAKPADAAIPLAMTPAVRSSPRPRPQVAAPAERRSSSGSRGVVLGVLLVGLLGGGGWYGWQFLAEASAPVDLPAAPRDRGASASEPAEPAATPETGAKTDVAAASIGRAGRDAAAPSSPPSPQDAKRLSGERLQAGIADFEAARYRRAGEQFQASLDADPANLDARDWLDKAEKEVARITAYEREMASVEQFLQERAFHDALYKLYRVEPLNDAGRSRVDAWIRASWYNWGIVLLRENRPEEAREKLEEVLVLAPGDAAAAQHLEVAKRYQTRSIDPTYEAYVGKLELRSLP